MSLLVLLTCLLSIAAGYPVDNESPQFTILYDGPDGRHVQMGEPGRKVTGFFTSRSLDGLTEYRTDYVADENGYRPVGEHLPQSRPMAASRSDDQTTPFVINYDLNGQSHYQMGEPGKAVEGSFMFNDADGRSHRVDYIADEKGYRIKSVDDVSVVQETKEPVAILEPVVSEVMAQEVAAPDQSPDKTFEGQAPVEQTETYSTYIRDSDEMAHVSAAQSEADETDKKPVEQSLHSSDALELAELAQSRPFPEEEEQTVKLDEESKEETPKVEAPKSHPEAESLTQTEKVTFGEASDQAANEKNGAEGLVDPAVRYKYEQYAAQRSKFDGALKDKHLLSNYPFYASYAPSFYAQQRRYPLGYLPYQYPSYQPFHLSYQYPYRFFSYY